MIEPPDMLRRLAPLTDPAVDRAIVAALPSADADTFAHAAALLLARRHAHGLLGVIQHFHRLPAELASHLVSEIDHLYRPLREAMQGDEQTAVNALSIIRQATAVPLLYLVTRQLIHGGAAARRAAADALLHFARLAAPDPDGERPPMLAAADAAAVVEAVSDAVEQYGGHEQRDVLLALVTLLPRPMPRAMSALGRVGHPGLEPMRRLCERAEHPAVCRALPVLVATPTLTDAALAGLRRSASAGDLAEVLQGLHLWGLPAAHRALLRVRLGDRLVPEDPLTLGLEPAAGRGLPALVAAMPMDGPARLARLCALAGAPDPATRLFALRRLLDGAGSGAPAEDLEAIARFIDDPEPAIARLALWRLIHAQYAGLPRILARLLTSPHEPLRRIASGRLAPVGFARFWQQWPRLAPAQRLAAGRALIKIDDAFHKRLGDKLQTGDRLNRLRALSILQALNQGAFFEQALLALISDRDETVASAAVKALGSVATPQAKSAVGRALHHPDPRIRANAVEALALQDVGDHATDLEEIIAGPEHRPRANAIAAMMQVEPDRGLRAVAAMLSDDRPRHRTSALWLVETLGLVEVARQVAEMAVSDPDPAVQTRADRVVHDLMDLMSTTPVLDVLPATEEAA